MTQLRQIKAAAAAHIEVVHRHRTGTRMEASHGAALLAKNCALPRHGPRRR